MLGCLASCAFFPSSINGTQDCKKESIKKLKKLKKHLSEPQYGGVYNYLYKTVDVPPGFETIFWERKINREYAVSIQLSDTTAMQFLQLPLALQELVYSDCDTPILESELTAFLGPPTFVSKSFLPNAKQSLTYSFNHPSGEACFHDQYMGNVAYQACLSITLDVDNRGRVVELNTSSFELEE